MAEQPRSLFDFGSSKPAEGSNPSASTSNTIPSLFAPSDSQATPASGDKPSGSLFGTAPSNITGAASSPFGNLFGGANSNQGAAKPSGSLFASSNAGQQSGSSPFSLGNSPAGPSLGLGAGQAASPSTTAPSLFGATSTSGAERKTPSLFGTTGASGGTSGTNATNKPGGLFGTPGTSSVTGTPGTGPTANTGFSFGQKPQDATNPVSTPPPTSGMGNATGALFGAKPNTTGGASNVFGAPAGSSTPSFGSDANAPSAGQGSHTPDTGKPTSSFGFGSTTPIGPPPPGSSGNSGFNLFGKQNAPTAAQMPSKATTGLSFGSMPATSGPTATSNLFGSSSANTTSSQAPSNSSGLFSATSKPSDSQQGGGNLFANMAKSQGTQGQSTDAASSATSSAGPSFPLGAQAQKSGFLGFGQQEGQSRSLLNAATPSSSQQATPATNASASLFPSTSATAATGSSATGGSLFPPASTAGSGPASTGGTPQPVSAQTPQPATSAAAPSSASGNFLKPSTSGLFGAGGASASSAPQSGPNASTIGGSASSVPGNNDRTANTAAPSFGSSTVGPAPTAQSRLKNKSMDDIITRWASDLTKYQKDFQSQAGQVAAWDRLLVENSEKISKLYSKTFQAERDAAEVERQLANVEGQQDELAQWLDRYEQEVDNMMSHQSGLGEGLQGPDQDRERTYKLAEKLSDRMNGLNKDLADMIEEINGVSATLSKTKSDNPLSQVVRVLNSHLAQLQQIDMGAASLQKKIEAAQKEGHRTSANGHGGLGNDHTEDFMRSYMRR